MRTAGAPGTSVETFERDLALSRIRAAYLAGRLSRHRLPPAIEEVLSATPLLLPPQPTERILGRAGDCDFVIPDPSVSRHHAVLRPVPGGWEITDLGSTNGTRVNGWRVEGPTPVRSGDTLGLGRTTLRVVDPAGI